MNFAYADPPYKGLGQALYGRYHDEASKCDDNEFHTDLIRTLVTKYPDGWALSCLPRDLATYMPLCPPDTRIAAWVRTDPPPWDWPIRSWQPVIFRTTSRNKNTRPRDALTARGNSGEWAKNRFRGSKPPQFNDWILELLGYNDSDTLDDLFPGTGSMTEALTRRRSRIFA